MALSEDTIHPNFEGFSLADLETSFKRIRETGRADEILVAFYTHEPFGSPDEAKQYLNDVIEGGD